MSQLCPASSQRARDSAAIPFCVLAGLAQISPCTPVRFESADRRGHNWQAWSLLAARCCDKPRFQGGSGSRQPMAIKPVKALPWQGLAVRQVDAMKSALPRCPSPGWFTQVPPAAPLFVRNGERHCARRSLTHRRARGGWSGFDIRCRSDCGLKLRMILRF